MGPNQSIEINVPARLPVIPQTKVLRCCFGLMNREDLPKRSLSRSPRAVDHPTWPQTAQRRSPAARCEAICGPGVRLLAYPCLVRFWYVLNVIRTVQLAAWTAHTITNAP